MKKEQKLNKIIRSRELRKEQTPAEATLWRYLRNRHLVGHKFRRQFVFRGFILDFYCAGLKLAIELDGPIHDRRKIEDLARQKIIEGHGIKVLRLKNELVMDNINKALGLIRSHFSFPSPRSGEGGILKEDG